LDASREEFAWVTGTWLVPPPGEFWVNGYWRRDAKGWYRVPGFWSGGGHIQKVVPVQDVVLDERTTVPSLTRPEEPTGNAPGPDYFYIPGEYIPSWGGVAWRPGYWALSQPGWEWIPARWERRPDNWVFHEGFWYRLSDSPSPRPGGISFASAPAVIGSPAPRLISSPGLPANGVTARGETDAKATETSQSGQWAGKAMQNGAPPKPGETKPGTQQEFPQQPPFGWSGSQPVYPRAPMWNAKSAIGGVLRQVLP
jgi:hypothetical protein